MEETGCSQFDSDHGMFGSTNQVRSEDTPLIQRRPSHWSVLAVRYHNTRKCISSKAALLILFWSFTVTLANGLILHTNDIMTIVVFLYQETKAAMGYGMMGYGFVAFILIFYPLAGFLADVKFGRYKTVLRSLYLIVTSLIVTLLALGIGLTLIFTVKSRVGLALSIIMFILAGIAFIFILVGFIGFTANVIQFGMDQLHDSPGEDRTLFIHWFIWVYYISAFLTQLTANFQVHLIDLEIGVSATVSLIILLLIVSVCLGYRRRRWFLIEPGRVNPYKLVYRVSKFAYQHRTPVNRSAFTYCEDELPSGLDLGKNKYGGPFTTEEVEDVKAFYGILKVVFSFGMVSFLDFGANTTRLLFARHNIPYTVVNNSIQYNATLVQEVLLDNGLLTPLLIFMCIPLYLFLLRPFISYYIPSMLKRMGIGMCLMLLSLMLTFSLDTAAHYRHKNVNCMFTPPEVSPQLSTTFNDILIVQNILASLSKMLGHISVLEFICSQSPHSMKGLLIGLWYAIQGLYQMFAAALIIPYIFWSKPLPSCGFGYYLMNILVDVFAVLVYVYVARRYKYRERDEPCHVRRYAEDYYSNPQQEKYYDYD